MRERVLSLALVSVLGRSWHLSEHMGLGFLVIVDAWVPSTADTYLKLYIAFLRDSCT